MIENPKARRITLLDTLIIVIFAGVCIFIAYRIKTGIHYRWNWAVIPQYLIRFDAESGQWVPNLLLQGFFTTIKLSFWAMISATLLGTAIGVLRTSSSLFQRLISRTYVETIRNLPPLVLVFIFYYFISQQLLAVLNIDTLVRSAGDFSQRIIAYLFVPPARFASFISAVAALAIYEGAYISEIVRSGIQSVDKGQWEAAHTLGLSKRYQLQDVILPQAFRKILPPLAGQLISTIKDSAIVSVISIQELTFQGMELMAATYLTFEIWITITVLYFILTYTCAFFVHKLELYYQNKTY